MRYDNLRVVTMKITRYCTYVLAQGSLETLKCIYQTVQHHIPEDTYLHNQIKRKKHLYMTKPALISLGTTDWENVQGLWRQLKLQHCTYLSLIMLAIQPQRIMWKYNFVNEFVKYLLCDQLPHSPPCLQSHTLM